MTFLPSTDREYLLAKGWVYEELESGGQKGVVIKSFELPPELFDAQLVDVLIILPSGYPDVPPDMFYTFPWVRIRAAGRYPSAADQPVTFGERSWQRWSRHSGDWRPGRDGIHTMIRRVEYSVQNAKA